MRKSLLIIGSIIGVLLLLGLCFYLTFLLGMKTEDIIKTIPLVSAQILTAIAALVIGLLQIAVDKPKFRLTVRKNGSDIELYVHTQNQSAHRVLVISRVDIINFLCEEPTNSEHIRIEHEAGLDLKYKFRFLGDPENNLNDHKSLFLTKRLTAKIRFTYEGSGNIGIEDIKFKNPFFQTREHSWYLNIFRRRK